MHVQRHLADAGHPHQRRRVSGDPSAEPAVRQQVPRTSSRTEPSDPLRWRRDRLGRRTAGIGAAGSFFQPADGANGHIVVAKNLT